MAGPVEDMKPLLLGQDPRPYETRFWDMVRGSRQSPGGIAAKATAGIELPWVDLLGSGAAAADHAQGQAVDVLGQHQGYPGNGCRSGPARCPSSTRVRVVQLSLAA